jgi:two-component system chemotaxis response regulator CheY
MEKFKILIGDDSILARKQLKDIISAQGSFDYIEAKNGQEAVDMYKSNQPDLVFLDIVMPIMDGISAVKGIIAFDPKADIILVSTIGTLEQLKKAIKEGAHDFIQKPPQANHVSKIIATRFGGK